MKDVYNIYIMNADGTAVTRITDSPYVKRQPVFSPDGMQICYVGYPHGISNGGQLFIVDLKTKKEYRVTKPGRVKAWPGKVDDRDPDWHE
jgi:Tol biopolymer transport system component